MWQIIWSDITHCVASVLSQIRGFCPIFWSTYQFVFLLVATVAHSSELIGLTNLPSDLGSRLGLGLALPLYSFSSARAKKRDHAVTIILLAGTVTIPLLASIVCWYKFAPWGVKTGVGFWSWPWIMERQPSPEPSLLLATFWQNQHHRALVSKRELHKVSSENSGCIFLEFTKQNHSLGWRFSRGRSQSRGWSQNVVVIAHQGGIWPTGISHANRCEYFLAQIDFSAPGWLPIKQTIFHKRRHTVLAIRPPLSNHVSGVWVLLTNYPE